MAWVRDICLQVLPGRGDLQPAAGPDAVQQHQRHGGARHRHSQQPPGRARPGQGPPAFQCFANGFPGCPGEGRRFSAPRRPSTSSLRHPSLGEESTHALIAPEEQSHTYVNAPAGGEDAPRRSLQPLPAGSPDARVFLQPGRVKFVLGPTPARRHVVRCQGPGHNNNEGASECPARPQCTYENVGGGGGGGAGTPGGGLAQRRAALLHYENLPALPPVWEAPASAAPASGDDPRDGLTPSSTGAADGDGDETPLQKPPRARRGAPRVFSFDFRRPGPEPARPLNYIQVELKGWAGAERAPGPPSPPRRADAYAVIDLKKTVAMCNLQRARPRDDGTARKTRHNSTDLPV
ncbi:fibroblast growth factor receptor substrate 3 isoform X2 [Sorex fumeus]|uniref:fibroblast growth factor receptor substrate 3 isoform X2 n=1 Tax=Sorex fumeus TaxID=62283 RepID=UPI0024AE87B8|nr:fibroblast growth factor receptor substrate 3 isoform X2 [Sorex fumeus]